MSDMMEFVDNTARQVPRGWRIVWADTTYGVHGVAMRSPLTGAWLVDVAWWPGSTRRPTLKRARSTVLPGNGRQSGGHSSVDLIMDCR